MRAALILGAITAVVIASSATAPVTRAECWPTTEGSRRVERPILFTATVRDVSTAPDLEREAAGEGPAVLWRLTLDVGRDFGGNVPRRLRLDGSSLESGNGGGCSWFLGDQVKPGEVLFVALDELIPF